MAPFPYLPMTAIMACLISQQVVVMSVFAYSGFMVEYLGAVDDKDKAGYYAGFLSAGFMIGRGLSSHFWGLVADRYSSRFVLICGLVSTAVLSIAFGLSKTFEFAFACRLLLGLFNGMTPASKALVSEVCRTEHETVGMGLLTSSWSLGAVLGPGVGGMLVDPAETFPGTFSEHGIFGRNPYLLSNVVGAGLAVVSLQLVLLFLKGTKDAGRGNPPEKAWYSSWCNFFTRRSGRYSRGDADSCNAGEKQGQAPTTDPDCAVEIEDYGGRKPSWMQPGTRPPHTDGRNTPIGGANYRSAIEAFDITKPSWMQPETTALNGGKVESGHDAEGAGPEMREIKQESLLAQRHVVLLLIMEAIYSVSYSGFDEVYALWALSSASKGGLEWSSQQIGQVFFVCGLMVLVFELAAVPYLTPWLGVRLSQRLGSVFEVPIYFFFPFMSSINGGRLPVTITALILLFTCYVCTNSFFVGTALAINTAVGADRRGEINGISTMITSITKAASPIMSASLFAYSINSNHGHLITHHLVFFLLGSMRLVAAWLGWSRISDVGTME